MPRKLGPGKPGTGQTRLDLGAMSGWGSGYGAGWGGGYGGGCAGRQRRKRGEPESDEEPEVNTKDGASLGLPAVPRMDDDDTKLATGYKPLGME